MTYQEIRELIAYIDQSGIMSFEIKMGDVKISLSKSQGGAPKGDATAPQAAQAPIQQAIQQIAPQDPIQQAASASLHEVTSPLVGTFFAASAPEAEPFAPVGKKVKKGDVLCILEAMKVMNEVVSDVDGVIAEVLAVDGEMVEALKPLFKIET